MNCFFHSEETAVASCVDCGKSLCKSCAARYKIAICDDCNKKRNETDKNIAVKKFIPSLVLFILGFIAMFALTSKDPISSRIGAGIFGGWGLGGAVWGLYLTRPWFRPKVTYVNSTTGARTSGGGLDARGFMNTFRQVAWVMVSVVVGFFAMPAGLIKLIIAFAKAKKVDDSINTNKEANGNN